MINENVVIVISIFAIISVVAILVRGGKIKLKIAGYFFSLSTKGNKDKVLIKDISCSDVTVKSNEKQNVIVKEVHGSNVKVE